MALTQRLELRQSQSLIMTPQLQQAIKLLQLSNIELSSYVEEQIEKNPLLEIDEASGSESEARDQPKEDTRTVGDDASGDDNQDAEASNLTDTDQAMSQDSTSKEVESAIDADYDNLYTDESRADRQNEQNISQDTSTADWSNLRGGSINFDSHGANLEATLSNKKTRRDHLIEQLNITIRDTTERAIGLHLIDTIDEAGYIREDLNVISDRLGTSVEAVAATLQKLQAFEPAGIFCRNLAECLALQLAEKDRLDPAMKCLVDNLDILAKHDLDALMRICDIDAEDLADMIKEIRQLDPKPGSSFSSEVVQPVVPDVYVRETLDGSWRIELNSDTLPRVLVNQEYYTEISQTTKSKADKTYLAECYTNANWLVKSLDQRAKTILKVATQVVKQQDGFLVHGVEHLRPLNLKTIAEAIDMHESTVSRVTTNKYMATPRGLFEMKYFFTSAIASSTGGEAHSAESVRHKIKRLIDHENPNEILSDDRIVEILKVSGVDIARRTVAKYREALKIPSSVQRRRIKRMPT